MSKKVKHAVAEQKARRVRLEDVRERLASIEAISAPRDIVTLGRALVADVEALFAAALLPETARNDSEGLVRALPSNDVRETFKEARALDESTEDPVGLLRTLVSDCAKVVAKSEQRGAEAIRQALSRWSGIEIAAAAAGLFLLAGLVGIQMQASSKHRVDEFNAIFSKGTTQQNANDHASAVESFKAAISVLPDQDRAANAWNDLGWSLHSLGKDEEALDAYKKALLIRPVFERARNNLEMSQRAVDLKKAVR